MTYFTMTDTVVSIEKWPIQLLFTFYNPHLLSIVHFTNGGWSGNLHHSFGFCAGVAVWSADHWEILCAESHRVGVISSKCVISRVIWMLIWDDSMDDTHCLKQYAVLIAHRFLTCINFPSFIGTPSSFLPPFFSFSFPSFFFLFIYPSISIGFLRSHTGMANRPPLERH